MFASKLWSDYGRPGFPRIGVEVRILRAWVQTKEWKEKRDMRGSSIISWNGIPLSKKLRYPLV